MPLSKFCLLLVLVVFEAYNITSTKTTTPIDLAAKFKELFGPTLTGGDIFELVKIQVEENHKQLLQDHLKELGSDFSIHLIKFAIQDNRGGGILCVTKNGWTPPRTSELAERKEERETNKNRIIIGISRKSVNGRAEPTQSATLQPGFFYIYYDFIEVRVNFQTVEIVTPKLGKVFDAEHCAIYGAIQEASQSILRSKQAV